jgi:hypothetical protein
VSNLRPTGGFEDLSAFTTDDLAEGATNKYGPDPANILSDGGESKGAKRTFGNVDNQDIAFKTNNEQRFLIKNDGKIGWLDSTAPSSWMELIKNQNASTNLKIANTNAGTSAEARLTLANDAATQGELYVESDATSGGSIFKIEANGASLDGMLLTTTGIGPTKDISIAPAGTVRLRCDENGKIRMLTDGTPTSDVEIFKSQNAETLVYLKNNDSGAAANAGIKLENDSVLKGWLRIFSSNFTSPADWARNLVLSAEGSTMDIVISAAGDDIRFQTNTEGTDEHIFASTSGVTFNEQGRDADFRIEGDTDINNFCLDASVDSIGIGLAAPKAKLHSTVSTILGCENAAKVDGDLGNSQVNIWVDEAGNNLTFKVKYSNGTTVKSGTVALS